MTLIADDEAIAAIEALIKRVLDERERAKESPDDVIEIDEAAAMLKITSKALTRRAYRGTIKHAGEHAPGTAYRFRRGDLVGGGK